MTLFRWIVGAPFAGIVTAGLFLLMAFLIREKPVDLPPPIEGLIVKITTDEPPPEGGRKIRPPSETIPNEIPETELDFTKSNTPSGPIVRPGPTRVDPNPPGAGAVGGPTIRIAPPYPETCRSRGVEGLVVVEFDVTPEGNVVNPRVVDTPNACFTRPILKAVSNWKYAPASGGGMRYGVIERFNFQLED